MKKIGIGDLHCDTLCTLRDKKLSLDNNISMVNLNTLEDGYVKLQDFACFAIYTNEPYKRVCDLIETYNQMHLDNKSLTKVLSKEDLSKDGILTLLSIEEGGALEGKMERLYEFYKAGVRLITLTWNFPNEIGYPNDVKANIANTRDGLTDFGKALVKEMNKLGVVVDISHLGDKGALEVLDISTKPVVASHSGARSIAGHVRNLTDEMILKLIKNRGFIGINFCHDFLTDEERDATINDVVKHINHIKALGGILNVGFGSDFDGISNQNIEMKNPSFFPCIMEELRKNGYSEEELELIGYKNIFRVLNENL